MAAHLTEAGHWRRRALEYRTAFMDCYAMLIRSLDLLDGAGMSNPSRRARRERLLGDGNAKIFELEDLYCRAEERVAMAARRKGEKEARKQARAEPSAEEVEAACGLVEGEPPPQGVTVCV